MSASETAVVVPVEPQHPDALAVEPLNPKRERLDPALLGKIRNLLKAVGYIQHDARNEFHKYNYLSDKRVKEKVQPALVDIGLWMKTDDEELDLIPFETTNKQGQKSHNWLAKVRVRWTLYDTETGESTSGRCHGVGIDTGDKALYKAYTGGSKYMWRALCQIASGDDPENEAGSTEKAQAVAEKKLKRAKNSIERVAGKTDLKGMIQAITGMKEKLRQVHPNGEGAGADRYYDTLAKFGVTHGNDKRFMADQDLARNCWKALAQDLADCKSMTASGEQMGLVPADAVLGAKVGVD